MIFVTHRSYTALRGYTTKFERTTNKLHLSIYKDYTDSNGEKYTYTFTDTTIELYELRQRKDYKDYSVYGLYVKNEVLQNLNNITTIFTEAKNQKLTKKQLEDRIKYISCYATSKYPVSSVNLMNITALSMNAREDVVGLRNYVSGVRLLTFFVPLVSMDFTQMPVILAQYPKTSIIANEPISTIDYDDPLHNDQITNWMKETSILPDIELRVDNVTKSISETIGMNTPIPVTVYCCNKYTREPIYQAIDIYLEKINGYISKDRITIDPSTGRGIVTISPYLLEAGDTMKLKAGFRYFPGITECTFTVVDTTD